MSLSPNTALFRLWLIMNMWSSVASGPAMRFTEHGNVGSVTENGGSHTIWNSGMRKGTAPLSAPASRKVTKRLPDDSIWPSVGQSLCLIGVPGVGGTNASVSIAASTNAGCQTVARSRPWGVLSDGTTKHEGCVGSHTSGLVKMKVKNSFGFASRKVLTSLR
jgi:hypothetical protein